MNCPICHNEMIAGCLLAPSSGAIFWIKAGADAPSTLWPKRVKAAGGILLDKKLLPFGFYAKERNVTYHCAACRIFLAPEPEED